MLLILLLIFAVGVQAAGPPWVLYSDWSSPQIRFAAAEIRAAMAARSLQLVEEPIENALRHASGPQMIVAVEGDATAAIARSMQWTLPAGRNAQSYSLRRAERGGFPVLAAFGAGHAGAMYGGLDIAEAFRFGTQGVLASADKTPHVEQRGIKFNIPLDLRTPSYSDNSDDAQANIPEMWNFDFWREFLDDMARHRFNVLSLWNLHPFPSLVKVPEFPEVALNDVLRTRVPFDDTYTHSGSDMFRPELMNSVEVVRKMTIGQKIRFWRDVMQYAHDRGIAVYWFTWNIFTFGADGKHGITQSQTNPRTIEYFRASVREMVLTYPRLAGFGITSGEQMENRTGEHSKEKWLWKTYGLGVADAKKIQPWREIRMIHRYHMTGHDEIQREWKDYPGPLDLSFKYSIAHMYSIPNPPFIQPALPHLGPNLRTWLTVRDDDYYSFRWGDPAYARAYIGNFPGKDKMAGFYMGPDGTIWGRESLSKEPQAPRQTIIDKRWYGFMIWGRLSYEPDLPDSVFRHALASRFRAVNAAALQTTFTAASQVMPLITRFFWGDIDLRWFPEACLSHPRSRGFYTVRHFTEGETMPGSGILDIRAWRAKVLANQPLSEPGPLEIAGQLEAAAREVLKSLPELRPAAAADPELRQTLNDFYAMAHLGNYYAAKIRGAADIALFDKTADVAKRESAVNHLTRALDHWKRYAGAYTLEYKQPRLYNRVGWVDLHSLATKVQQDIDIARQWTPGTLADRPGPRQADTPFRK
ncbi:MAG: carbohydrate-binding family 6 protein [Bryobacteraceae bacterium]|nr:carbohydrate-binding family 6 protein [Bryobacteraceae bacterium]